MIFVLIFSVILRPVNQVVQKTDILSSEENEVFQHLSAEEVKQNTKKLLFHQNPNHITIYRNIDTFGCKTQILILKYHDNHKI